TEVQAANLGQASETLSEITQSVAVNAQNVESANMSSRDAQENAKDSGLVVTEASDAMTAIQEEAEGIANIVTLMEGISFQTNPLALNAGVEAARAGEAGRGFSVVASEVRALAQRSSDSAANIRGLIERSTYQVDRGSIKISDTVNALGTVETAIAEISAKMETISEGTQRQSKGITSINDSVAEIGSVTQQNAAMFEETSAACSNLSQGAEVLHALTLKFRVSGNASSSRQVA
ncbi:MAG: methyl-accepting chemotaxis protein, partial [Pseudomonadota bacterium]